MLDLTTIDEVTDEVRRAGDQALGWFRRTIPVDAKPGDRGWDPVTEADRTVEAALRAALAERFPDTRVIGEEFGESGAGDDVWIIDPVDGTRAFVAGSPMWGTLLGFVQNGRPTAGWMHLPALGETYIGRPGVGGDGVDAIMIERSGERRPLRTAATERLSEAVVACTHPGMFSDEAERASFDAVLGEARSSRFGGDCVNYGLVALGFVDAVIETTLMSYDIAGIIPIVEGAGGVVTTVDGGSAVDGGYVVAAANRALHDRILSVINVELDKY